MQQAIWRSELLLARHATSGEEHNHKYGFGKRIAIFLDSGMGAVHWGCWVGAGGGAAGRERAIGVRGGAGKGHADRAGAVRHPGGCDRDGRAGPL